MAHTVKNLSANTRLLDSIPGLGRSPWRREWQPTPLLLLGEFQGQRSLAVYSPWDHKESDTTEATECTLILVAQLVKNLPAMQETLVQFLGWEDTLEKG